MKYLITLALFFTIALYQTCCQKEYITKKNISKAKLLKVSFDDLDRFKEDNLTKAFEVFKKDCKRSKRYKNLKFVCKKAFQYKDAKLFFTQNFTPYQLINKNNSDIGLITGYYEPYLNGSLIKTNKYKYPIYGVPNDLLTIDLSSVYPNLKKYRLRGKLKGTKVIPYDTREQIEKRDDLKAICYVDDKIDLFFLQIQGSGRVKLQDGTILNIAYANQNGQKYYPIGRKLIQMGVIDKKNISLQTIREYLQNHLDQVDKILNLNKSYVFFRQSSKRATGSLGVELVAFRNLAVDRSYIPLGYPVFIDTTNPLDHSKIQKLTVSADTGGAIKGEIRADFFFGSGKLAEKLAGNMKQKGKLYILLPN